MPKGMYDLRLQKLLVRPMIPLEARNHFKAKSEYEPLFLPPLPLSDDRPPAPSWAILCRRITSPIQTALISPSLPIAPDFPAYNDSNRNIKLHHTQSHTPDEDYIQGKTAKQYPSINIICERIRRLEKLGISLFHDRAL
ncbi:hypothetical protein K443DRAFT_7391 [Laccaria amethystina LaAM-08-1]|jgi:hypothetical protein|uniref:Uncharacterized protein n=1 Tax=Laccaria amethystina LaAM-08-1 TaxID=1095629 RepID=A0A0C9XSS4_9AGAR|nr:hypothetical protein K443DRAFT_7391 [Laccaria amethystina LaAM-08-1]